MELSCIIVNIDKNHLGINPVIFWDILQFKPPSKKKKKKSPILVVTPADVSSNLKMVVTFTGATLDVPITSVQWISPDTDVLRYELHTQIYFHLKSETYIKVLVRAASIFENCLFKACSLGWPLKCPLNHRQ